MDFIQSKTENGVLTLFLSGRVDSSNAPQADAKIEEIRTANPHESMVIDVEHLEYISSAGLRVILRLLKAEPGLKVINASTDVYDIFEMTGFSEMMPVEKAFRQISVEGCEVIGEGANGKVYRTSPDTIVKVYMNPEAVPWIERERELARRAFVLGVPTAIPFDIVKVGDKFGSVFELLNADSFASLARKDYEHIDHYVELSVELLKKIHHAEVKPDEMPSMKEEAREWVEFMKDHLDEAHYAKLFAMFEAIPEDNHMLHGDFHFKNVMMQNGEVLLIDMDTLCHGNPVFEFAAIYNAYQGYGDFDHDNILHFLGISYERTGYIFRKTLELYFGTADPEILDQQTKKARLVGWTRLYRRCMLHNTESENARKAACYLEGIVPLIDELDGLAM